MPTPEPPYRRIAAELRAGILAGELRPGERLPSVRQIAQRWGVAAATATRVMATLRDEGLAETRVGSGAVVARGARPAVSARTPTRRTGPLPPTLTRAHLLRAAVAIADREGLDAVTMRRVAADLGVGPMSLYRHVATKDELVHHMVDDVVRAAELPDPGPDGWRPKLELVARRQWALCRRHLWLPRAISFTRPLLIPGLAAYTEWTLRALDGLGLSPRTRLREALTLHALVINVGASLADEIEAEHETGVTLDRWRQAQQQRTGELLDGRFPLLAAAPVDVAPDLDGLFEYGLARHLDGFAVLLEQPRH
ncbi:GntR family transcriptional regulator [Jiangella alkaliphila]|uniref:Tetracyclin repressor, C-terminal all-alpha domain n=1 Tax=Jiangella alkaliphila TaxID=419479 RepID=A0A1H2KHF6_9ACTN|nr:GntR family transcriptional regulator [Jiangella alkaliphila]SDU68150.1 Tetracyclin repressor, C-terminal all-alpha domain [Jiangella alkaliphila]